MLGSIRFVGGCFSVVAPVVLLLEALQPSIVRGASMAPTLHDGQRILVERLTPLFGSLRRGDVVVLNPPDRDDERYVKRIVGLGGDVVRLHDGKLTVDGKFISECIADHGLEHTWIVPSHACFVLGDNFERSFDSRLFGTVPTSRIVGKVIGK